MRFSKMDSVQADQLDFVPRERQGHIRRLGLGFIGVALALFFLGYMPSLSHYALYAPLLGIVLLAILCLYVVYHTQIHLDLATSTEFQNMLYSQALSVGSAFTLIVRRDGSIVHASDGLKDIFPDFNYSSSQALAGVFEQGTVRTMDRDRIMNAIYSGGSERLVFPVIGKYTQKKDYIITVEPLPRPSGFCLVRGREYLGQRAGLQVLPDTLRSTSIDKIDHLLATTSIGHYITDQYGRIEYVNPTFEHLLGYRSLEIVEHKLSLHHLFFSFGTQAVTEESTLSNYEGRASVVTRDKGRQPVEVRQTVIRDGNGKAIGVTGSVVAAVA